MRLKIKKRDPNNIKIWEWTLPKYGGIPHIPEGKHVKINRR